MEFFVTGKTDHFDIVGVHFQVRALFNRLLMMAFKIGPDPTATATDSPVSLEVSGFDRPGQFVPSLVTFSAHMTAHFIVRFGILKRRSKAPAANTRAAATSSRDSLFVPRFTSRTLP